MLYNTPTKGDDGCYFVRATGDDKKKCFIQLNKVHVSAVTDKDLTIELVSAANAKKIAAITKANLQAAKENAVVWFGKQKTPEALKAAYSDTELVAECIPPTKVFSAEQQLVDFSKIQDGRECSIILEYAGMWFAKTAFGPSYNIVQLRLHPEPVRSEYPEEYAFAEEEDDEPSVVETEAEVEVEVVPESTTSAPELPPEAEPEQE